jgi:hypothetical protein
MAGFYKGKGFLSNNSGAYVPPMSETNLADLGLSSSNIDDRLIYLYSIGTTGKLISIYGNDARTSASDAAFTGLTTPPLNNTIEE